MDELTAARVARETIRAYQLAIGDAPSPPWDQAEDWDRESMVAGVQAARAGASPEEMHARWCRWREARGWTLGPVKDPVARTHPNLRPYHELPEAQRRVDRVFVAVAGPVR